MSWIIAGMAALGALKGLKNEKKEEKNTKLRSEVIKYSPWTGMSDPGALNLPGVLESGIAGAGTGAMMGNLFGKGAAGAEGTMGAGTMGSNPGGQMYAGQNMLGGQDMANQLGARYQLFDVPLEYKIAGK